LSGKISILHPWDVCTAELSLSVSLTLSLPLYLLRCPTVCFPLCHSVSSPFCVFPKVFSYCLFLFAIFHCLPSVSLLQCLPCLVSPHPFCHSLANVLPVVSSTFLSPSLFTPFIFSIPMSLLSMYSFLCILLCPFYTLCLLPCIPLNFPLCLSASLCPTVPFVYKPRVSPI
jgi:hypothetical protein